MGAGVCMVKSCAVIVPVLARPNRVLPLVESFVRSNQDARLYFVVDDCDAAELQAISKAAEVFGDHVATIKTGSQEPTTFAIKCNIGYRQTSERWLLFIGDDVSFGNQWLVRALLAFEQTGRQFISTNDLANPHVMSGEHAIHPIVARAYIDEMGSSFDGPGVVACEEYHHNFVDNEWTAKAKQDGEYIFAKACYIRHHHPVFDTTQKHDATYERGMQKITADELTWRGRRARFVTPFDRMQS